MFHELLNIRHLYLQLKSALSYELLSWVSNEATLASSKKQKLISSLLEWIIIDKRIIEFNH